MSGPRTILIIDDDSARVLGRRAGVAAEGSMAP